MAKIEYNEKYKIWGEPYRIEGKLVCTATHPGMPNFSGHSRGRKIHLAKSDKLTICNMRVDGYIPNDNRNCSTVGNGCCKICFRDITEEVVVFPD